MEHTRSEADVGLEVRQLGAEHADLAVDGRPQDRHVVEHVDLLLNLRFLQGDRGIFLEERRQVGGVLNRVGEGRLHVEALREVVAHTKTEREVDDEVVVRNGRKGRRQFQSAVLLDEPPLHDRDLSPFAPEEVEVLLQRLFGGRGVGVRDDRGPAVGGFHGGRRRRVGGRRFGGRGVLREGRAGEQQSGDGRRKGHVHVHLLELPALSSCSTRGAHRGRSHHRG